MQKIQNIAFEMHRVETYLVDSVCTPLPFSPRDYPAVYLSEPATSMLSMLCHL